MDINRRNNTSPAMSQDNRVCEQCGPLFSPSLIYNSIHTSVKKIRQTKLEGCPLCSLIHDGLIGMVKGGLDDESIVVICPGIFGRPMEVLYGGTVTTESIVLQFYVREGISSPVPAIGFGSDIASNSMSASCFDFLGVSVTKCDQNHPECQPKSTAALPRRVIDLGSNGWKERPKLYVSKEEKSPYTALSHCWGTTQTFKTELATFEERTSGIDFNTLPQTFRDAIIITRNLGIRYIWIDSLCIIQDDRNDWEMESGVMSKIYANSYLTIAASSASSDECGFLGPRSAHIARSLEYKNGIPETKIQVREQILHEDSELSTADPLFTRAWAFQELLVSRRVVCYSSAEIQWHCQRSSWCECDQFDESSLSLDASTLRQRRRAVHSQARTTQYGLPEDANFYHRWYSIVEAYPSLRLTVPTDRLPALSALAQLFSIKLNDTYMAGLWKGDIRRGLRWQTSWDQPAIGKLPQKYLAPSWSWVSIDGKVFYERSFGQLGYDPADVEPNWASTVGEPIHDDFVDVCCNTSSANYFGEINGGFLKISGRHATAFLEVPGVKDGADEALIPYTIWPESDPKPPEINHWPPIPYRGFKPDVPLVRSWYTDEKGQRMGTVKRSTLRPGQARDAIVARVWTINICEDCFLVLVPSNRIPKSYERIGFMRGGEEWKKKGIIKDIVIV